MDPIVEVLFLVSIALPILISLVVPYNGIPELLVTILYTLVLTGMTLMIYEEYIIQFRSAFEFPYSEIILAPILLYPLFVIIFCVYSQPIDRIYPKETVKIQDPPSRFYGKIQNSVLLNVKVDTDESSIAVEIHGSDAKWFRVFEDEQDLISCITSSAGPHRCCQCDEIKEDIRVEGVVIKTYGTKGHFIDSRTSLGSRAAYLCRDCTTRLIEEINKDTGRDINSTKIVAAEI